MGVSSLVSLKVLNLADNIISLLPRKINQLTFLDKLDLSKNQLKALPLEFTDILVSSITIVKMIMYIDLIFNFL